VPKFFERARDFFFHQRTVTVTRAAVQLELAWFLWLRTGMSARREAP